MTARELIDRIIPEHNRSSCSDENLSNGVPNQQGTYRCARCVLLEGIENGFSDTILFIVSARNKPISDAAERVRTAERELADARRALRHSQESQELQ